MKLGKVDYARDTTPHDMTTLVGQRNVCGLGKFWATTLDIWQKLLECHGVIAWVMVRKKKDSLAKYKSLPRLHTVSHNNISQPPYNQS